MKIAILSDIHDQVSNLKTALNYLEDSKILLLIFCGDLCSPFILKLMGERFSGEIQTVFGNNDGDQFRMSQVSSAYENIHLHGEFLQLNLNGFKIAANHFPEIALSLQASAQYDLICYGHDHRAHFETSGGKSLLNPGTLMGYDPGADTFIPASFAVFDTDSHQALFYQVSLDQVTPLSLGL